MYNGGPDISDISMQPSEGGTTSLPSIHFPSGEEGGEETTYSVERDGMPRVTKSGIYLGSRLIRFSEARTKKALLLSGIQPGQLQPRARDEFSLGAKLPAVADRRFEAYEDLRARHLQLVLDARSKVPKGPRKAETERVDDTATLLKMEAALKARILKAAKHRMQGEERQLIEADEKKEEKLLAQRAVDMEIHRRKEEREDEFAARRDASIRDQRRREAKKTQKTAIEAEEAIELADRAARKQLKIEAELAVRQERFRKRRLVFAEAQQRRVAALGERNEVKEQERLDLAADTGRKMRQRDAKIAADLEAERLRLAEQNRMVSDAAEKKRMRKKEKDRLAKLASQRAAEEKVEAVEIRMEREEERKQAEFEARRREEAFKLRARASKQEEMAMSMQQAAGDSVNKSERKVQVLAAVQERRDTAIVMKTETARLNFEAKRQNIERMKRVAEYEHRLKCDVVYEKDRRLSQIVESKKQLRMDRKAMAQQFLMDKKILASQMEEMLRQRQRHSYQKDQKRLLEDQASGLGASDSMLSNWRGNAASSRSATSMF